MFLPRRYAVPDDKGSGLVGLAEGQPLADQVLGGVGSLKKTA